MNNKLNLLYCFPRKDIKAITVTIDAVLSDIAALSCILYPIEKRTPCLIVKEPDTTDISALTGVK